MLKKNCNRKGCKDIFKAFLVRDANYSGGYEIPKISGCNEVPQKLILFSKTLRANDYNQWVCFYEDDYKFERIWNNPKRYLTLLKKFEGVILPDFSVYRDMPLCMQLWNIYRSRAIGTWLENHNIKVIPNIRFGDERTFQICCDGISNDTIIAIGTYGIMKSKEDKYIFEKGLNYVIEILKPKVLLIYGSTPKSIFKKLEKDKIIIKSYQSDFAISRKQEIKNG